MAKVFNKAKQSKQLPFPKGSQLLTADVLENIHCNVHLARYLAQIKRFDSLCSSSGFDIAVISLNFVTASYFHISSAASKIPYTDLVGDIFFGHQTLGWISQLSLTV